MEVLWFWLILIIVMILVELMTVSFGFISFGIGGIGALLVYLFGGPFWLQLVVFILISLLVLIFLRPVVLKTLGGKKEERLNANIVIDKTAIVTEKISFNFPGAVKVLGKEWTAIVKSRDLEFSPGDEVLVKEIEGVKLVVVKLKD
ncbi:MAG: NfeD family protein [Fusobacteria bacterium]|nr:NfeD family protein [Fusobacteriota bacterium]